MSEFQTRSDVLKESTRKGRIAGAMAVATVGIGVIFSSPVAVIAAVPTAIAGWSWWKHRKENGIRF